MADVPVTFHPISKYTRPVGAELLHKDDSRLVALLVYDYGAQQYLSSCESTITVQRQDCVTSLHLLFQNSSAVSGS